MSFVVRESLEKLRTIHGFIEIKVFKLIYNCLRNDLMKQSERK